MKLKLLFIFALLPLFTQGQGLEKNDIGALSGASYYMGNFNLGKQFYKPSGAIGISFRHNLNEFYSFKIAGLYGQVQGEHVNTSYYLPDIQTPIKFSHQVLQINVSAEIGFMPFSTKPTNTYNFSPYVTIGGGVALINEKIIFNIPFGIGIKYSPFNRWTFGAEWRLHKTLNDNIDNYITKNNTKKLTIHNNDWIGVGGFFVSYRLVKSGAVCPAYY